MWRYVAYTRGLIKKSDKRLNGLEIGKNMVMKRKVLVADASKVVRASLAKQLAEYFDVREEASGESAWQTLVLDSAIVGVVSGVNLNRLDGLGLLERVRDSKLARIRSLPFFLVVSSSFGENDRQLAQQRGATDFISKDSSNASLAHALSILWCSGQGMHVESAEAAIEPAVSVTTAKDSASEEGVGTRTDVGVGDILGQMGSVQGLDTRLGDAGDDSLGNENPVGEQEKLDESLAGFLIDAGEGRGLGILAFGLDGYDNLLARYGSDLLARTVQKFSFMIARKIRPEDVIAQLPGGKVVILAPGMTSAICTAFANRICKAMAMAQIAVRGQRIDLTVSAGIAVAPEDGVTLSGQELLNLAYDRLDDARRAGGNQVMASANYQGSGEGSCETFVPQLKNLLASIDPALLRPCLGTVGLQLMPILKEIERTLRLGMPIDDMNRRLWDRARTERMV